jgi:hypothetical protein
MEALGRFKGGGEGVEGLTDGWMETVRSTCSAWGLITFLSWDEKGVGGEVKGFTEGRTEVVRSTSSAWGLIIVHSRGESTWGRGDSYLSLVSSGLSGPGGILLSVSCNARGGGTFRNEEELVIGRCCEVTRIELADKIGAEFVTPSRCAARASFEADISDSLEEDLRSTATVCVLSASEGGCNGASVTEDHW